MRIIEVATSGTIGTSLMGPVSTVTCELSNRFAARGHEVTLVDFQSDSRRALLHPAVRVVQLEWPRPRTTSEGAPGRIRHLIQTWSRSYSFARHLSGRIDLAHADVVHMHSPELGFLLQRMHGIRGVYTAHTPLWSLAHTGQAEANTDPISKRKPTLRGRLYGRFAAQIEKKLIRSSALTLGLGNYLQEAMPGAAVTTIANGLDLAAWQPLNRSKVRQALNIQPGDFAVVFTGRIAHVKGIDVLLSSIRLLADKIPNLKVFIIGSLSGSFDARDSYIDPYARSMMEAARGLPVEFLGFISNRDPRFRQYIAAADVSVVPSRLEPQGLVVLESLALGTPVIGSNTGGISAMVTPDVGCLVTPGDSIALAGSLQNLFAEPERLQAMQRAARARVESQYSWDSVADRYLVAFAKTLEVERIHPSGVPASVPSA
jgi:glycosyltransferase involved in cell wall biosynthesis